MELRKSLAAIVLASLLLVEAHAGIIPGFSALTAIEPTSAVSGNFAVEGADPKYGKTWIASITCANNGQQQTIGGAGDAEAVQAAVRNAIDARNLPITKPTAPLLRSDGGWDTNDNLHYETLNAVCGILGFSQYVTSTCRDEERTGTYPNGKCNFHSPHNNELFRFQGTFSEPKAACEDGIDNDGDGKVDMADPDCSGPDDNNEGSDQCSFNYQSTNILTNGDFETPVITSPDLFEVQNAIAGWQLPTNWMEIQRRGVNLDGATGNAGSGQQWAELDVVGTTQLSNTFTTKVRYGYKLTFEWSPRPQTNEHQSVDVLFNNVVVATISGNGAGRSSPAWQKQTVFIEAGNQTSGTLAFRTVSAGNGGRGMLIDDVRLFESTTSCSECSDNIDNDGDGAKDANDFSCSNPDDDDETNPKAQCQDGIDNDNDGKIDYPLDPGCDSKQDNDEFNHVPQCQDGIDNDGDGFIDFPQDPGCTNDDDDSEDPVNTANIQITDTVQDATVSTGDTAIFVLNLRNTGTANAPSTLRVHNTFKNAQGQVLTTSPFTFEENTNTSVASCAPHSAQYPHNIVCELLQPLTANGGERTFGLRYATNADQFCGQTLTHTAEVIVFVNNAHQTLTSDTAQITVQCAQIPQCRDGIDNDNDGAIDHPADFSCSGPDDNDETNPKAKCQNGIDDDNDGLIDFGQDPGCTSLQDNDETNALTYNFTATKTADRTSVKPGEIITYTITATNNGTQNIPQVRVIDPTTSNLVFVSAGSTQGCVLHSSGLSVQCPFASYAPGQTRTYTLRFQVPSTAACGGNARIDNVADLQYPNGDGTNTSFVWSNHEFTPVQCAQVPQCRDGVDNDGDGLIDFPNDPGCTNPDDDSEGPFNAAALTIEDTATPTSVTAGGIATFAIRVQNTGNAPANQTLRIHNIFIDNAGNGILPSPMQFIGNTNPDVSCAPHPSAAHRIVCSLSQPLAANGVVGFDLRYQTSAGQFCGQSLTHQADVRLGDASINQVVHDVDTATVAINCSQVFQCSDGIDNDGDGLIDFGQDPGCTGPNDDSEINTPAGADLSITKTGPASITRGSVITYTLTVTNHGPNTAQGVTMTDPIPTGLSFNAAQSDVSCIQNGPNILCDNLTLAPGASKSVLVSFNVPTIPNCTTVTIRNTATVSSAASDPNPANNVSQTVLTTANCPNVPQCSDGVDNDGDGLIDFPNDPGCSSAQDNDEFNQTTLNFSSVKTTNKTVASRGELITYTITARNEGATTVQDIRIRDNVPAGTEFVTQGTTTGCVLHNDPAFPPVIFCPFEDYAPGQLRSYTLVFRVKSDAVCSSIIDNVADIQQKRANPPHYTFLWSNHVQTTVQCSALPQCSDGIDNDGDGLVDFPNDPGCSSSTDNDETDTQQTADLSLVKSGAQFVQRGSTLLYTLTATNAGPNTATNVIIQDTIPQGLATSYNDGLSSPECAQNGANVLCNNFSLASGQSRTVQIVFDVPSTLACESTLTNVANVAASSFDPNSGNNFSQTVSTTVKCPNPILVLSKTDGKTQAAPGETLTYTLTLQNVSTVATIGQTVTDTLPQNVTFVSASNGGTLSNGVVTWNNIVVPANSTVTLTLTARVNDNAPNNAVITNTMTVGTLTAQDSTTVTAQSTNADLAIVKTGATSSIVRGNNVVYTISVTNNGPAQATGIVVNDTFPLGLTYVSVSGTTCQLALPSGQNPTFGGTLSCELGTLAAGATKTFTATFSTSVPTTCTNTTITNSAAVTSTSTDPVSTNNVDTEQTTLTCPTTNTDTDLSLVKTGPTTTTFGEAVTYTLTVKNNGTVAATNVVATDTFPSQMVFQAGSSSSQCSLTATNTVKCTLASLDAGQQTAFTLVFKVGDPPSSCTNTTITNTAVVSATNADPTSGNNSSTVSSSLTCTNGTVDQLSISKSDGRSSAYTQERLRYMITVNNNQTTTVNAVTITDTVPSGLSILSVSDGGTIAGQTVTWSNQTFTAYQSRTYYVDVEISDSIANGTVVTNTATVGSKQATDQTTIQKQTTYQPPYYPPYNPPHYPPYQPPHYPPVQPPIYQPPVQPPYYPPIVQPPIYGQPKPGIPPIYVYPETGGEAGVYADATETDNLTAVANADTQGSEGAAVFYATLMAMLALGSAAASKFLMGGGMLLG